MNIKKDLLRTLQEILNDVIERVAKLEEENYYKGLSKLDELVETKDENVCMFKDWECGVIKKCLEYAKHRIETCTHAGIHKARVKIKDIERILEKIK